MRLLVCGGRHFEDAEMVHHELTALHWRKPISVVVHGSIAGVGIIAEAWARRGAVAELVGIEVGVVSGVINLESSGVEASDWRLRHEQAYHEARFLAACD